MIRPTTFIDAARLARRLGLKRLMLASETFQYTGSFKFRAALNVVSKVPQRELITASSGNFGQGLAYACRLLNKKCTVVMPNTSARTKVEGVQEYGGIVDIVDTIKISRAARVADLAKKYPDAYVASAYDDPLVIEGNATLGKELADLQGDVDCILAAVGGGGLTSGIITGLRASGSNLPVIGVEPLIANDAARSLRAGKIIANDSEPQTLADGVRTPSLGQHNWKILKDGLARIIEVSENSILEAVRLLFNFANLKAEPTGALGISGILTELGAFNGKSVCCVISGANVDSELFQAMLDTTKS
jgi:threonine dehydratase